MSISLLKTLIAISEKGSFTAAAGQVHVSQAAVGQQMKRLEDMLGIALFDRSQKTPRLSPAGKDFVPKAVEVVAAYEALIHGATEEPSLAGEFSLGAVPSTLRGLVPRSAKRLVEAFPDLQIRVVPGLSDDLREQVERGALDAAITSKPEHMPKALQWQLFAREDLVLITAQDVTEADPLKLLRELPYIRHTRRAAAGGLADLWLSKNRINPRTSMEMESIETVSSMVANGLGISVVPNICVPDAVFSGLRKIPLSTKPMSRSLGILNRADSTKTAIVARLLDEIGAMIAEQKS
ncbi:MAG: LysR family transcriptional regulator [Litoreibacter sp.]|nr:LysR family transcriptional regulator [Litoreibacter sp.]